MGTPVVTIASTLLCAHGGTARALPGTARVYANGVALLCVGDPVVVTSCPATQAQPRCTAIQLAGAARVRIQGRAVAVGFGARCEPNGLPAGVVAASERVRIR